MSTFGGLSTAYSGLKAAQAALDITGQNVSNANTVGYTRQRVDQVALSGTAVNGVYESGANIGSGVTVTGISRLNDALVDAQVRSTASTAGYWDQTASALSTVETSLNEPSDSGLSETLNSFWTSWGAMANDPTDPSTGNALISQASTLTSAIKSGYTAASDGWSTQLSATTSAVQTINETAKQVAQLNLTITQTVASGGNANELKDQRDTAITTLSQLAGATTRTETDGSIDVIVGGNTIVSGSTSRTMTLAGATTMQDAAANPVHLEFSDNPGAAITIDGGAVAGRIATLAAANSTGTGGAFAQAAKAYNDLATQVATQVNAIHETGTTPSGTTGVDFFSVGTTGPAALTLSVIPTSVSGIASANSTLGTADGSIADAISQIGTGTAAPDSTWATYVSSVGSASKSAASQSSLADSASTTALSTQTSQSGVDLDEETTNLIVFQHAYQAAARVMSTIDSMLDTLINHTGGS